MENTPTLDTGVYPKPNRSMGPLPPCVAPHPAIHRRLLLRAHGVSVPAPAGLPTPSVLPFRPPCPDCLPGQTSRHGSSLRARDDLGADATLLERSLSDDQRFILRARRTSICPAFPEVLLSHPRPTSNLIVLAIALTSSSL